MRRADYIQREMISSLFLWFEAALRIEEEEEEEGNLEE